MADTGMIIELTVFDPDSIQTAIGDDVWFRLGEGRNETVVTVKLNGSPDSTLFGTSTVTVGSEPVAKRVLPSARGDYTVEADQQEGPGEVKAGKKTMTGTIKVSTGTEG